MHSSVFTPAPQVTFSRDPHGNLTAKTDTNPQLVGAILAHAGFTAATTPSTLPTLSGDLDIEAARDVLAQANHILRAAGYVTAMPPELKTIIGHTASLGRVTGPTDTLQVGLAQLDSDLYSCEDIADIARLADTIFNEGEGVLVSIENFAEAAAHRLAAFDTEKAGAIADQFLSISRRLDTITAVYGFIGEELIDLHDDVTQG